MGFPLFAYSTRYTALHTPTGTEIKSVKSTIIIVFIIAGINETLSVVYVHSKSDGVIFGMPFTSM